MALLTACGSSGSVQVGSHRTSPTSPHAVVTTSEPTSPVPALQVHNPTVLAVPSQGLGDGQTVTVRVTGFGPGSKVRLSECGSQDDANINGCGDQVATQPFLVTGDDETGATRITLTATAYTKPYNTSSRVRCTSTCVLVASNGGGFATTPLNFLPS